MRLYKLLLLTIGLLAFSFLGQSQSTENLVGYYSFDALPSIPDESPSAQQEAKFLPNPDLAVGECGVQGDALYFDGTTNYLVSLGTINNHFSTTDFTLSFYFKPYPKAGLMDVISKKSKCDNGPGLSIRYKSNSSELIIAAVQDSAKRVDFITKLDITNCWHHIVLVREGNRMKFYYNGELMGNQATTARLNLKNNSTLNFSGGPCIGKTDTRYRGLIDEVRIYNRALKPKRVEELYFAPDRIVNQDTIIYLGESVQLNANSPCGISYQWLPENNVSDPKSANPVVMPQVTTTYTYQVNTGQCVGTANDEVTITVVDPSKVDCSKLLFPTAFTPNHDGLNEEFTFDTPLVVLDEFKLLEIFDRWGNRVFYTEDSNETWKGTFGDKDVNPGVFLYRAQFVCQGEKQNQVGQVTLIR